MLAISGRQAGLPTFYVDDPSPANKNFMRRQFFLPTNIFGGISAPVREN